MIITSGMEAFRYLKNQNSLGIDRISVVDLKPGKQGVQMLTEI